MLSENLAKQLHDKSTRGQSLSTKEQSILGEWYAAQDKAEGHSLGISTNNDINVGMLQEQVDIAVAQLTTVTTKIQEIASENEALEHEIILLRRQLAHQAPRIQAAA